MDCVGRSKGWNICKGKLKGTELGYDYNFEWYGGAKVQCLCGAPTCCGFLGAKSRGFQEDTYLWEDDDDRYSVEKIPLYDSAEDEPSSKLHKSMNSSNSEYNVDGKNKCSVMMTTTGSEHQLECDALVVQPPDPVPMEDAVVNEIKVEASEETKLYSQDTQQAFSQKNAMISRIRSNSACRNYHIGPRSLSNKRSKHSSNGRLKQLTQKQVDVKCAALLLTSKEAQEEILRYEVWAAFFVSPPIYDI
ncbi:Histone-lysine N-methyltransferase ASHH1 [Morella rubra]|uniref:Histone-lysine N-methyltransferase ASHH1 n=1 Tax=Morella rubra TaxID=262757 RepID=A0A6A1UPQ0_9ROSI|nr:Histone-lysine N-methyltransferase ASHH1 [Morella rubra]